MLGVMNSFKNSLAKLVRAERAALRRDGITGMSSDNLWALVAGKASRIPGAPAGTNAAYVARSIFNEIVSR